jgi:ribosomal protein S27AE
VYVYYILFRVWFKQTPLYMYITFYSGFGLNRLHCIQCMYITFYSGFGLNRLHCIQCMYITFYSGFGLNRLYCTVYVYYILHQYTTNIDKRSSRYSVIVCWSSNRLQLLCWESSLHSVSFVNRSFNLLPS